MVNKNTLTWSREEQKNPHTIQSSHCPDNKLRSPAPSGGLSEEQTDQRTTWGEGALHPLQGDPALFQMQKGLNIQYSEYTLSLQVGVRVMAAKALGMLAHIASLWARLRRWDQAGKNALLAAHWGLEITEENGK